MPGREPVGPAGRLLMAPTDGRERFARLRLARSGRIGPVGFRDLLGRFGSAVEALQALEAAPAREGGRTPSLAREAACVDEIRQVEGLGARHIVWGDADYPRLLREVPDAPAVLIAQGNAVLASGRCVAMVGARNASAAACRFARDLARDLADAGVVVVSGLARGVDAAAHQGALAANPAGGGTVGVIASGIDVVYPPGNAALQRQMGEAGLVLTEHPPGTEPLARHFPHRNRIIAGLSAATLVVEAAPKSGSLITARLAGDYGRDVLAVPGSPLDPRARGCNQLIRDGAILVQSAEDVLEALAPLDGRMAAAASGFAPAGAASGLARAPGRPPETDLFAPREAAAPSSVPGGPGGSVAAPVAGEADVCALLGPVPVSLDELVRQSGLGPAALHAALLDLELAGRLERHPGGRVSLLR